MNRGSPSRKAASAAAGAGVGDGRGWHLGREAEAGAAGAGGAAPEAMMGKEEEITRIARRLDKMVTKKSAVRGAGRQDPGTPAPPSPPSPPSPRQGPGDYPRGRTKPRRWPSRDLCPGPALPITPAPTVRPRSGLDQVRQPPLWTLTPTAG